MKKALILGLGKSGLAAARLIAGEYDLSAWDSKAEENFDPETVAELRSLGVHLYFGAEPSAEGWDLIVMSPGISPNIPLAANAVKAGAAITGELELAFTHCKGRFFAITGTNGKTTTTALVGEMVKAAGIPCEVVGNIGLPATSRCKFADENTVMVTEVSSFQLETTSTFCPAVSSILNITPDHLNRHGSFEEYARVKTLVYANQKADGWFVFNCDDPETLKHLPAGDNGLRCVPFSRKVELDFGACVKNGAITICDGPIELALCRVDELKIPGNHNIENALAAAAMAYWGGIDPKSISQALKTFAGVAHRIEFIREVKGVRYVNDSKGTNPDASIKAIEATNTPILLIAGGYEKNSDFTEFIESFGGKVKELLLMGFTAKRFAEKALELGYPQEHIHFCKDMADCVATGYRLAQKGDTVLLSPASASWDMYKKFEDRGDDFRGRVLELED